MKNSNKNNTLFGEVDNNQTRNNNDRFIDLGERGRLSKRNKLNELTGKEWIQFTKTWFIHRPKRRNETEILHPAKYPESLIREFILFFTKKGQSIIDPFAGTGSTNLAAKETGRNCIGIELNKKYANIANRRLDSSLEFGFSDTIINEIFVGNSNNIIKILKENYPLLVDRKFDFCITSPPYWNQLKRNSLRQQKRKIKGWDTVYSNDVNDIGNEDDYNLFLKKQKIIFNQIYKILKDRGYLVVITNNVFANGRVYPLAFDTFISLCKKPYAWVGKDEKIWCQDDKELHKLGINNAWVGNRMHQYCLIFRKEKKIEK